VHLIQGSVGAPMRPQTRPLMRRRIHDLPRSLRILDRLGLDRPAPANLSAALPKNLMATISHFKV
jgi:hypothetical protein